ncbi:MAG: hypothetical protein KGS49_12985, partial [Planctomycetes bacterium]|nr:hypothetical protein [Planctomycetota bacterium]
MSSLAQIKSYEDLGSVSNWLKEIKSGDVDAVEAIWKRYYQRVVDFAIQRMKINP